VGLLFQSLMLLMRAESGGAALPPRLWAAWLQWSSSSSPSSELSLSSVSSSLVSSSLQRLSSWLGRRPPLEPVAPLTTSGPDVGEVEPSLARSLPLLPLSSCAGGGLLGDCGAAELPWAVLPVLEPVRFVFWLLLLFFFRTAGGADPVVVVVALVAPTVDLFRSGETDVGFSSLAWRTVIWRFARYDPSSPRTASRASEMVLYRARAVPFPLPGL